jgi:16S rRNA (uracil1498-N3)-methyltransferase
VSAPQFFVPPLAAEPSIVVLDRDDSRHALRSLRLRPGEAVSVSDGEGRAGAGTLLREEGGLAVVEVTGVRQVARARPAVAVRVAPPKGDRLRWMVQKLAEIGTDAVWLAPADRSVRTLPDERADAAARRLAAVAREAAMQARQPFLMRVEPERADTGAAVGRVVLLHVGSDRRLSEVLPAEPPEQITLCIGPEGGFTAAEVAAAEGDGSLVASLGPGVLRTETAAVVGAALTLARYGRLG